MWICNRKAARAEEALWIVERHSILGGFVFCFLKSAVSLLKVDVFAKASLDTPQISKPINITVFIGIPLGTFRVAVQIFLLLTALAYLT